MLLALAFNAPPLTQGQQTGLAGPRPEEVIAEALQQAIALEKLPDVRNLLTRDTIEVEGYIRYNDGFQPMLASFLPGHVDRWVLRLRDQKAFQNNHEVSPQHHLVIRLMIEHGVFRIELICQPHIEAVDRGKLSLEYECLDGVLVLKKLTRGYG
jgi:hypothetical protein